jgi:hypothetical protein
MLAVRRQVPTGGANGHQQGAGATGENVTDAEFEEVK